ncbi:UNVERIFIED_CONTAM: hypothetical protein H355_003914 [Colinus virginianus]|nr:hypothetical protein H355_003914 [Colinus virginianus]
MNTIRVSVRGNKFLVYMVCPPALPVPICFGPSGTAAAAEHMNVEAERVGGLLPEQWAALFRQRPDLLWPVLPWLEEMLSVILGNRPWQIIITVSTIQVLLCQVGLDRAALVRRAHNILGAVTAPLMERLINVIVTLCGPEARRLLGLPEPNDAQQEEDGREEPDVAQQHEDGPAAPSLSLIHI